MKEQETNGLLSNLRIKNAFKSSCRTWTYFILRV